MKKSIVILCLVLFAFSLQGCTLPEASTVDPYAYVGTQMMKENADTAKVSAGNDKIVEVDKSDEVVEEEFTYDLVVANDTDFWWAIDNSEGQCFSYDNNIILIKNHNQSSITYVKAWIFQTGLTKEQLSDSIDKFNLDKEKCVFNVLDI